MFGIVTKSYRKRSICVPGASTGSTIGESAAVVRYAAKYAIGHSTDGYTLSAAGGYKRVFSEEIARYPFPKGFVAHSI